jgi:hypothetical protein
LASVEEMAMVVVGGVRGFELLSVVILFPFASNTLDDESNLVGLLFESISSVFMTMDVAGVGRGPFVVLILMLFSF